MRRLRARTLEQLPPRRGTFTVAYRCPSCTSHEKKILPRTSPRAGPTASPRTSRDSRARFRSRPPAPPAPSCPLRVERTFAIDALVRVRAEEVALRLRQVRRQALARYRRSRRATPIIVGIGRPLLHARARRAAPARPAASPTSRGTNRRRRAGSRSFGVAVVGVLDAPEELRADDAAALPDARDARPSLRSHSCVSRGERAEGSSPARSEHDLRRVERVRARRR